jgi:hypothetical protein
MPSGSSVSPLLRCMDQLDMDTLVQVLLPKLMQQGSAHSVAVTCSRLRDLCYSSVEALQLKQCLGASLMLQLSRPGARACQHTSQAASVSVLQWGALLTVS